MLILSVEKLDIVVMVNGYCEVMQCIEDLVDFLKEMGFEADFNSHLEDDYLCAHKFFEDYRNDPSGDLDDKGRAALCGLYELYKWIWSVKDCDEFSKLNSHLKLLIQASPRINAKTPMISPVTNKQDDKTNKFVEAIIGMFAVKYGTDVDLDDPVSSSDGENPDVMFTYNGERISIACKTLRGDSASTLFANIKSAAEQIERSDCDKGYILINAMNILKHEKITEQTFSNHAEPLAIIEEAMLDKYKSIRSDEEEQVLELFNDKKLRPVLATLVHSVCILQSPYGRVSTSLKSTIATDMEIPDIDVTEDIHIMTLLNEFVHNKY